jgi:putative two-component system response regulator
VYDALRSARPYKRAFDHQEALSILADGKSRHFDPQLLDVFMSISDIMLTYSEQWKDV